MNVTEHPTAYGTAQPIVDAFPDDGAPASSSPIVPSAPHRPLRCLGRFGVALHCYTIYCIFMPKRLTTQVGRTAAVRRPKPTLGQRALLSPVDAVRLMALFKVLASDTRLRLLHALVRAGELSVTDLARTLGMTPQAVSNQLQRLVDRRIVTARRNGNSVHYRITDPCVPALLDQGLCLVEDSLTRTP